MRPKTYRLYNALQRREIQLEKLLECVHENDKFCYLYKLELKEVRNALNQLDITTEI